MKPISKIRIAVADDQMMIRRGIVALIKENKKNEIAFEASDGKELLENLKSNHVDLIVLDLKVLTMNAYEALEDIRSKYPDIKMIILTMHDDDKTILDLVSKGVNGFVSKSSSPEYLHNTINLVIKDDIYFDKRISQLILKGLREKTENPPAGHASLSSREISVLKEICNGYTNKMISEKLFISPRTVDFHKSNIYRKIKSNKTADVIKYAISHGIIQLAATA
jgi:DNA-binding NarL/FixJ family response regulator